MLSHSTADLNQLNEILTKMNTREKAVMAQVAEMKLSIFNDPDLGRNAILNEIYKGSSAASSLQGMAAGLTKDVVNAYEYILKKLK